MFGCQQVFLDLPLFEKNILEFLCEQANKLVNCATFNLRQAYFAFRVVNHNAFELLESPVLWAGGVSSLCYIDSKTYPILCN
jgi:hypothetical protein